MLKNILNRQLTGRTNPVFYGNFPPNILYAPELNTTHMDEIQHILNRGEVDNAYLYWYDWVENSPDEPPTRAAQDEAFQNIEQAMAAQPVNRDGAGDRAQRYLQDQDLQDLYDDFDYDFELD